VAAHQTNSSFLIKRDGTVYNFGMVQFSSPPRSINVPQLLQGVERIIKISTNKYVILLLRNDGTFYTLTRSLKLENVNNVVDVAATRFPLLLLNDGKAYFYTIGEPYNPNYRKLDQVQPSDIYGIYAFENSWYMITSTGDIYIDQGSAVKPLGINIKS
jgi:hypothetical protein